MLSGGILGQAGTHIIAQHLIGQLRQLAAGSCGIEIELQQRLLQLPALAGERVLPGQQRIFLRLHLLRCRVIALLPPGQRALCQAALWRHAIVIERFTAQQPVDQPVPRLQRTRFSQNLVDQPRADA